MFLQIAGGKTKTRGLSGEFGRNPSSDFFFATRYQRNFSVKFELGLPTFPCLSRDDGAPIAPIANQTALGDRSWSQKYAKYYSAIHQTVLY